ncbi:MAG TPA: hypothetical protein VJZ70_04515 [Limnochordia bacterium]|nr:hypothetical protein [Limnochordia bacterium]
MRIVNPAPTMAMQVAKMFPQVAQGLEDPGAGTEFWVSGDPQAFQTTAELLLGERLPAVGFYTMSGEST